MNCIKCKEEVCTEKSAILIGPPETLGGLAGQCSKYYLCKDCFLFLCNEMFFLVDDGV